ncbi:MAG TPA: helix-turn-helix domain-containing protein [Turneriella sp.]|nr:helix-turn-helix domain-containing protein [Turneriella sp.]
MDTNNMYLAIMSDILDSGTWAKLGPAAKALYPVLCKFSNHSFKPVWPGTDILLKLTGFKTKKSLQEGKRELVEAGLIHVVPGTGRTPSYYYFRFDYPGSKVDIESHRDIKIHPREIKAHPSGSESSSPEGVAGVTPNHINIHINKLTQTTNNNNPDLWSLLNEFFGPDKRRGDFREQLVQEMLEKYGSLEVGEAVRIAISKGKDGDIRYLEGILKNRGTKQPGEAKLGSEEFSFTNLPAELKIWQGHLTPMGKFESTWYFSASSDVSPSFVEEQFRRAGLKIRVIKSRPEQESAEFSAARSAIN